MSSNSFRVPISIKSVMHSPWAKVRSETMRQLDMQKESNFVRSKFRKVHTVKKIHIQDPIVHTYTVHKYR